MRTLLVLGLGIALAASAESKSRIATLNAQRAVLATSEAKTAAERLKAAFAAEQAALGKEQVEIDDLSTQIHAASSQSAAEPGALRMRLAMLTAARNRHQEDARARFEQEQKRILNELAAKLLKVVEQYARQKHFDVILDESDLKTPVYWRASAVDITDKVVERYEQAKRRP